MLSHFTSCKWHAVTPLKAKIDSTIQSVEVSSDKHLWPTIKDASRQQFRALYSQLADILDWSVFCHKNSQQTDDICFC